MSGSSPPRTQPLTEFMARHLGLPAPPEHSRRCRKRACDQQCEHHPFSAPGNAARGSLLSGGGWCARRQAAADGVLPGPTRWPPCCRLRGSSPRPHHRAPGAALGEAAVPVLLAAAPAHQTAPPSSAQLALPHGAVLLRPGLPERELIGRLLPLPPSPVAAAVLGPRQRSPSFPPRGREPDPGAGQPVHPQTALRELLREHPGRRHSQELEQVFAKSELD